MFGIPDKVKDEKIIAVIEAEGSRNRFKWIKKILQDGAASYKIPEQFILRSNEQLPRTSTGKISQPSRANN